MNSSRKTQTIIFDHSTADACLDYLKDRSEKKLELLTATKGSRLAYDHHVWSSMGTRSTIEQFWKQTLEQITCTSQFEDSVKSITEYLNKRKRPDWLSPVLHYLPKGHVFTTTVYLIVGYDNIVYSEDAALNLNFKQFRIDNREAIYDLIHELAHAGYFRYQQMPDLAGMKTVSDLLGTIKLLTHLEGMGVISPLKLRLKEGRLLDNDYRTLLDSPERDRRIDDYFNVISTLEKNRRRKLREQDFQVLEQMSGKTSRLWYITGCKMVQEIEEELGIQTLRQLVKQGPLEFFENYINLENHQHSDRTICSRGTDQT